MLTQVMSYCLEFGSGQIGQNLMSLIKHHLAFVHSNMNYAFSHKAISEIKLMVETIQSMRLFKYRNVPFHSAVTKKKKKTCLWNFDILFYTGDYASYFPETASLADWRVVATAAAAPAKTPPLVVEFSEEWGW